MNQMLRFAVFLAFPAASTAEIVISEIDVLGDKVELVNVGAANFDLTGYYLCNRKNGSPFYQQISTGQIDAANSDTATLTVGPGQVLTLQLTAGFIPDGLGEFGLYSVASYGSSTAMTDYIAWGADGARDNVAAAKGIWGDTTFVAVTGMTVGQTIQLKPGMPGDAQSEYEIAASTIGAVQVAAPVELSVTSVSRVGNSLSVAFSGPPGVAAPMWSVEGGATLDAFPDDKTSDSVITETPASSGNYEAMIDVSTEGPVYFVRIVSP
ncbi:hypothetical protein HAHE_25830 [Haloferula helveola]|uniref:LTD domain-containing protein n=1 Tax=Haloferula helveola TaxID=490095 RepID=A0ABN6H4T1_9BACT|nr:hypothetical protein HAHE_25830 [Haloferula helveola]